MRIYLLRHGDAEDPAPGTRDADRRLTPAGEQEAHRVAAFLARHKARPQAIITSPLVRARQTAECVADALQARETLVEDARLAGGCRVADLQQIAAERPGAERLLFVGHNPDMSLLTGQLIGGASIRMATAGMALIETDLIEPGAGVLRWLVTPSLLKK